MKESDLFEPLKNYLIEGGHEVYAEVPILGKRADVVTKVDNIYTVVEMKTSMNLKLVEQAFYWRHKVNYVYVAVPQKTDISLFVRKLLSNNGIGIIILNCDESYGEFHCSRIYKLEQAKLFRNIKTKWEQHLLPEYKNNVGGSLKGENYTSPYKLMMEHVKKLLKRHPEGMLVDDIVSVIDTYYSNPKQGLFNALKKYEKDWCESFKVGRKTYFRLKED